MNCLRPLITHSPPCLHGTGLHRGFRHVVGQPAVGGAARLGQAMRQQELRILDEPLEPLLLQMARREVAQQHRHLPVLHQLVGESPESPRAISSAMSAKVAPRFLGRARCRRIPPARRACGCRSSRRLRGSRGGSRSSGVMLHSRCQFWRMNGMTTSSTKSRQDCRIRRCSSEIQARSLISPRSVRLSRAKEWNYSAQMMLTTRNQRRMEQVMPVILWLLGVPLSAVLILWLLGVV